MRFFSFPLQFAYNYPSLESILIGFFFYLTIFLINTEKKVKHSTLEHVKLRSCAFQVPFHKKGSVADEKKSAESRLNFQQVLLHCIELDCLLLLLRVIKYL